MRKELETKLNIKAYDIYGLTEICGPGVGGECECQNGTHLWEDHFFPEIVNVFPSQVESVILELPEFEAHYLIVVDRMNNTDTFQIQVEVRQEYYSDEMNKMIALKKKIAARMQSVIGLQPDIKIVEPRSIERSMGKAKHVIDKRKLV